MSRKYRKGQDHPFAKLTDEQVKAIYQDDRTAFEISLDFDFEITTTAINAIRRGVNWSHLTKDLTPGKPRRGQQKSPSEETVRGVFMASGRNIDIAKRYGISRSAVSRIRRRASWKKITENLVRG